MEALKRSDIATMWTLVVFALLVQILRVVAPSDSVWAGVSLPQAIIFPLFCVALWRLAIMGVRVPRGVVLVAAVCAVGALVFSFAWRGDRHGDFLIARLREDPYEAQSKVFRDRINSEIPRYSPVRAVRYYRELESDLDARTMLRRNPEVPAIVWGDERWISVSFRDRNGVVRLGDVAPRFALAPDLTIVTRISRFDLSRRPDQPTAAFIAKLLGGLIPERAVGGEFLPPEGREAELTLRDAGQLLARWAGYSHRGVAFLALGNRYLLDAIAAERFDEASLRCALGMFAYGQQLFRVGENRELALALANNEGVARMLLGLMMGEDSEIQAAARLWKVAQREPRDEVGLRGAIFARLAAQINDTIFGGGVSDEPRPRRKRRSAR